MRATIVHWLKGAYGAFSSQPTGCFDLRAKGVAFAAEHASSRAGLFSASPRWQRSRARSWRRGWDSNPRTPVKMLLEFQSSALDRSATSPINHLRELYQRRLSSIGSDSRRRIIPGSPRNCASWSPAKASLLVSSAISWGGDTGVPERLRFLVTGQSRRRVRRPEVGALRPPSGPRLRRGAGRARRFRPPG